VGNLVTGSGAPNAVMSVQPGMQVEAVTIVDQNGNPVSTLGLNGVAVTGTPSVAGLYLESTGTSGASWQAVSGRYLCPPVVYATSSQFPLTVAGTNFQAVSSGTIYTGTFTAPVSGSVVVTASFLSEASTLGSVTAWGLCRTGTSGTVIGTAIMVEAGAITIPVFQNLQFPLGGLSGAYSLDLMCAVQSPGTATVLINTQTATNPTFTSPGAPVTMTVQGV
jgi:hypothetical protein